eukprot:CAMPEP_0117431046 /NCGR_PEP_ID=MMETSP0758-20121206/10598_1 /TAXON_ID=63605 /ORGANISM="Percolomonas cosmopolitus, Strain AE-1 (ATCC 50343)" /LENGTH=368 /DNA_ID=CAMNT_0005219699 /DNA_START=299 /DNA_END=1408 /DNA_ORIENTATION=-
MLMNRVDGLDKFIKSMEESKKSGGTAQRKKGEETGDEDKKLEDALSSAIVSEKPNVKWSDVAGLEAAKETLREAVTLPLKFPYLFKGARKPWRGILLYGPPGTGKSYLAKAVATESQGTFFSVSSSDLVSKWQGESEKLVKKLFQMARENKPSVIFIDEVDSLCSKRSDGENDSTRRIKTEFMTQMDGVGNQNEGILVLAATNMPWGLDDAVRRRFERRIYIPLPGARARATLVKLNVGPTLHTLTEESVSNIANRTQGFSGADIKILVRDALMQPIQKLKQAKYFKNTRGRDTKNPSIIRDDMLVPCSPNEPGAQPMTLYNVPPERLAEPPVSKDDFEKALQTTNLSVSNEYLKRYVQFTKDYGQDG